VSSSSGDPDREADASVIRIVIVDDEPDLRLLLRTMLHLDHRIQIAGEAGDGGEALARYEELQPDVVVLDQRMPVMSGLEVAERILAQNPDQRVILFTAFLDETTTARARALGIASVMAKDQIDRLGPEIYRLAG
jgi:two-component system, chemotaxis family, chemotaxis protein CheY